MTVDLLQHTLLLGAADAVAALLFGPVETAVGFGDDLVQQPLLAMLRYTEAGGERMFKRFGIAAQRRDFLTQALG
nr:hypothetical protein [Pseudomonas sp. IT1137]